MMVALQTRYTSNMEMHKYIKYYTEYNSPSQYSQDLKTIKWLYIKQYACQKGQKGEINITLFTY